jgi:hypothetical protein
MGHARGRALGEFKESMNDVPSPAPFQALPLVITGLVVMGIVSPDALRTHRASILMGLWTASCFITPGADPYSPLIVGVAFTVLFFVSAGLVRFVRPVSEADPIQIPSPGVEVGRRGAVERVA